MTNTTPRAIRIDDDLWAAALATAAARGEDVSSKVRDFLRDYVKAGAALLAVAAVLMLSGCGSNTAKTSEPTTSTTQAASQQVTAAPQDVTPAATTGTTAAAPCWSDAAAGAWRDGLNPLATDSKAWVAYFDAHVPAVGAGCTDEDNAVIARAQEVADQVRAAIANGSN